MGAAHCYLAVEVRQTRMRAPTYILAADHHDAHAELTYVTLIACANPLGMGEPVAVFLQSQTNPLNLMAQARRRHATIVYTDNQFDGQLSQKAYPSKPWRVRRLLYAGRLSKGRTYQGILEKVLPCVIANPI